MNITKRVSAYTFAGLITVGLISPFSLCAQQPELPVQGTPGGEQPALATPGAQLPGQAVLGAPVAVTPFPTFAPVAPATPGVSSEARQRAFDPVRQAIARRDFVAARQALDVLRQQYPDDPALATFEASIQSGMARGNTAPSLVPTPRTSVTPLPAISPTPSPTPVVTPVVERPADDAAPSPAPSVDSSGGMLQQLQQNPIVMYVIYGVIGLVVLFILLKLFRRKREEPASSDDSEEVTPLPGSIPPVGSDSFDLSSGGLDSLATPPSTDFSSMTDIGAGGGAASGDLTGGATAAGGAPEFTAFGFDEEEEESAPKPAFTPRPAPAEEDDSPLSFDEGPASPPVEEAPSDDLNLTPPASLDEVSFEALGIGLGDDDTVAPAPTPAPAAPPPSQTLGEVNLDDIFGDSTPPATEDDPQSQTLPTFVSEPEVENPEDHVEIPGKGMRQPPADDDDMTISFDELFSVHKEEETSPAASAPAPAPSAAEPESSDDFSLEDALADAVSDMEAMNPEGTDAAPETPAVQPEGGSDESLDERTERMFADQMTKARAAVAAQDWRQAVHVLSIASALHPENEEARQMLREAREQKRKAEEGV